MSEDFAWFPTCYLKEMLRPCVVETLAGGVFDVEFSDESGKTYSLTAIPADSLIALRYGPVAA